MGLVCGLRLSFSQSSVRVRFSNVITIWDFFMSPCKRKYEPIFFINNLMRISYNAFI